MKNPTQNLSRIELYFQEAAMHYPNKRAIAEWDGSTWQEINYQSLLQQALQFSKQLQACDIQPGERVILISHNRIQAAVALLGIWFAQGTLVLIDPDLPQSVFSDQCAVSDARFVVIENSSVNTLSADYIITITEQGFDWQQYTLPPSKTHFQDCARDLAAIVFTSGTSGVYRGVMLSHHSFIYLINFCKTITPQSGCSLTVLPLFHVAGLFCGILYPLILGVEVVLFRHFSAEAFQSACINYQPTELVCVPRLLAVLDQKIKLTVNERGVIAKNLFFILFNCAYFLNRFCHINLGKLFFSSIHKKFGSHLKNIFCGSAQLSSYLQKQFLSYGYNIIVSYGLTETCGPITLVKPQYAWKLGSVGICAEKEDLQISKMGEIIYKGPALMQGYFRDPDSTAAAIRNGFLYTGDLGKLDKAHNLFISGRIKELIIFSDGKKAMPEQIEANYASISGMKEYAVFSAVKSGVSIAVLAFVPEDNTDPQHTLSKIFHCASQLKSPYRVSEVFVVNHIPRSSTLKVKRHALQQLFSEKIGVKSSNIILDRNAALAEIIACFQAVMPDKKEWIAHDITFAELGIDSFLAAQLCEAINLKCHLSLSPTIFWFVHTICELQDYLTLEKKTKPMRIMSNNKQNKIAIVALDCVFPGSAGFDEYWKNLMAGKDSIIEVPASRWHIDDYYDPYRFAQGKINSRYGGFIDFPIHFPFAEFNIKSHVADMMDPQQKILLTMTKRLLGNSDRWYGTNTGLFLGVAFPEFVVHSIKKFPLKEINAYSGIGMADFSLVSRIAFHFGLEGPALLINTACSSSLVAVHQAMRALQAGDCHAAIAGGINFMLEPDVSICLTKGGFLSPDGRCKTFDVKANGYVRSEGCGLVLLKRYEDAVDAGDTILGVIIGSAINQDGASNSITAPNGKSQINCYQTALHNAQVSSDKINYIEAHGSGTQLGDAIEMKSIQSVYDQDRPMNNPLYVGAVKSSIGHCESAGGVAGLIKTIAVLNHQIIPPNLHYHEPNPHISFSGSSVRLPQKLTHFSQPCEYAAVSSFGIAGTNAHMILQRDEL